MSSPQQAEKAGGWSETLVGDAERYIGRTASVYKMEMYCVHVYWASRSFASALLRHSWSLRLTEQMLVWQTEEGSALSLLSVFTRINPVCSSAIVLPVSTACCGPLATGCWLPRLFHIIVIQMINWRSNLLVSAFPLGALLRIPLLPIRNALRPERPLQIPSMQYCTTCTSTTLLRTQEDAVELAWKAGTACEHSMAGTTPVVDKVAAFACSAAARSRYRFRVYAVGFSRLCASSASSPM